MVAAASLSGSEIVIASVGVNPTRTGIIDVLRRMGADIHVDGAELSDARWFTRAEMKSGAEAGTLVLPGGVSISRSLVEHWYGGPLPGQWG